MTRHPLSVLGAWLATLSAFVFLFVFAIDLFGLHHNPYFGLVFFLILPVFFVIGLVLIPIGMALEHRRRAQGLEPRRLPRIDLNDPTHQRTIAILLALTIVNILIVSLAAYRGVEYMDSPQFCGQVCHTVMQPEFVAHLDGPHARVACVDCHVGEGAGSFIYYKLNGMRQLAHLVRGTYPKPVPSPVFNLQPAHATCETCHTAESFHGDRVDVVPSYASDEKNTSSPTQLRLHLGGGQAALGLGGGIHWHAQVAIDYIATDDKRQEIPYVRLTDRDGKVTEFRAGDVSEDKLAHGERRRMDCIDCHNRPTHSLSYTPERAVDAALARGAISPAIPFARSHAIDVLKASYPDRETADQEIERQLRHAYPTKDPGIDQLVRATQFLYSRNVFPAMNVTWGTHANNLGHTDSPGCFRCHDDQHKSADGRPIRQDCDLCHDIQ